MRTTFYYEWFPEGWSQEGIYPYTWYHPSLGFYASGDPAVVRKHIAAMLYGHIAVATYDWWGTNSNEDGRFPKVLALSRQTPLRWAVYYEAEGYGDPSSAAIHADLLHLRDSFFSNPAYLRINNRPVVFAYGDADTCDVARRWHEANAGIGAYLVLSAFGGMEHRSVSTYAPGNPGGVRVASGDVDGDSKPEIVAGPGPGAPPLVKVVRADGTPIASFLAGDPGDTQGISVAAADLDGDGRAEVVTGTDETGEIKAYAIQQHAFAAGLPGAHVAAADLDGDGRAEIVAGSGPGSAPTVKVFDSAGNLRSSFLGYESAFLGGVWVAVGDVQGDPRPEIVTGTGRAQAYRENEVRIFDHQGVQVHPSLHPYEGFGGGISVATGDVNGDGTGDIVTGADSDTAVRVLALTANSANEIASFEAFDPTFDTHLAVATAHPAGPGRAEVLAGSPPGHGGEVREWYDFAGCADQPDSWHVYGSAQYENVLAPYQFGISPGFHKIGTPDPLLPRDPAQWRRGIAEMNASKAPWHLVFTFNEWGEGTAFESAHEWRSSSGYGTYLDALHELP
jgi:hypothetical protein